MQPDVVFHVKTPFCLRLKGPECSADTVTDDTNAHVEDVTPVLSYYFDLLLRLVGHTYVSGAFVPQHHTGALRLDACFLRQTRCCNDQPATHLDLPHLDLDVRCTMDDA